MSGSGAAAAAAAAAARAIKASGAIVKLDPGEFDRLTNQNPQGLVVHAPGGFLSSRHRYLMGFSGLVFFTSSPEPLVMPRAMQVIEAKKIWIP